MKSRLPFPPTNALKPLQERFRIGALLGEPKCEVIVLDDDPTAAVSRFAGNLPGQISCQTGDRRGRPRAAIWASPWLIRICLLS